MAQADDLEAAFYREIVTEAERVRKTLTGDFAEVEALVADADLVFGVWNERTASHGVGYMIVKGQHLLHEAMAGKLVKGRFAAIPCTCAEQAEALRRATAEASRKH